MKELDIAVLIGRYVADLSGAGFEVLAVDDFELVQGLAEQTGRVGQTPIMSVERQDFTKSQAFWIFLLRDGEAVAGIACKLIDLGDEDFGSYLIRTARGQYGASDSGDSPILRVAEPISSELSGRLIYFGELEVRADVRGSRQVLSNFARLAKCISALRWPRFDWMCAIIPERHFNLVQVYEFTWVIPRAVSWRAPAPERMSDTHWMMASRRSHFEYLVGEQKLELAGRTLG